jgi:dual specificity tyrosine-phosphorylation-regulated kinase 2/3/4
MACISAEADAVDAATVSTFFQIYFVGKDAKKVQPTIAGDNNHGFDDDHSMYVHVVHDHIAYRYEILRVSHRLQL